MSMPSPYHAFHFPFISASPQLYKVEITHLEQGLTDDTEHILNTFLLNNKLTLNICVRVYIYISSVQFSHSVMLDSSRPHGLQLARLPCPSPAPGAYSNSRPSRQ